MNSSKNIDHCGSKVILLNKHTQKTDMLDNLQTSPLCALDLPKDHSFTNSNCCEQQIDFLNQCKSALSSEVVRWKAESHKLQKEKEKIEKEKEEIKAMMLVISQSNAQLEKELNQSLQVNERLKMHALAIGEENSFLHTRLTKSLAKFHSYPWPASNLNPNNRKGNFSSSLNNRDSLISQNRTCVHNADVSSYSKTSESWEQVSQKLLMQMKQEMKELQELNNKLTLQTSVTDGNELGENKNSCFCDVTCSSNDQKMQHFAAACSETDFESADFGETQEAVEELKMQMASLKQEVQNQNITMQKLLLQLLSTPELGAHYGLENEDSKKDEVKCLKLELCTSDSQGNSEFENLEKKHFTRPSDESFRAYFTQQLHGGKASLEEKTGHQSKANVTSKSETKNSLKNIFVTEDKTSEIKNKTPDLPEIDILREASKNRSSNYCEKMITQPSLPRKNMHDCSNVISRLKACADTNAPQKSSDQFNQKKNTIDEERICPMCQAIFPKIVSQHEFETHVVSHFETENGSLLEQYEVI